MPNSLPIQRLPKLPLSLTAVRWITEIPCPEDSSVVEAVEMFTVVREQYRLESVEKAVGRLGEATGFLPLRFWLTHDDRNAHDNLTVAIENDSPA